jgi:hypothetical protein
MVRLVANIAAKSKVFADDVDQNIEEFSINSRALIRAGS